MKWSPLFLLLLAGCPDPEKPYDPSAASGPQPPPGAPAGGASSGEGTPAAPPNSGATIPTLDVPEGMGVEVSGTFTYTGTAQGTRRIDFFKIDNDGKPMVLHALALEADGPWKTQLPKNLGPTLVLAFVDATGNGPDPTEPAAWRTDISVAEAAITGVDLAPADGASNPYAIGAPPQPPTPGPGQPTGVAPPPSGAEPAATPDAAAPAGETPGTGTAPTAAPPSGGEATSAPAPAGG